MSVSEECLGLGLCSAKILDTVEINFQIFKRRYVHFSNQ